MFKIGDKVIFSRRNYDLSKVRKTKIFDDHPAKVLDVKPKQVLLEFEKNHMRRWIYLRGAKIVKVK